VLPGRRLNAPAAAVLGRRVYVIGGFDMAGNVPTDRVSVYDLDTHRWSEAAPLPAPRGGHTAAVLGGRIHVIGGGNSVSTIADHDAFDPATGQWLRLAPLPRAEGSPATLAHEGRLYAIGGRSGPTDFGDVYLYDRQRYLVERAADRAARHGRRRRVVRCRAPVRRRIAGAGQEPGERVAPRRVAGALAAARADADGAQLRPRGALRRFDLRGRRRPGRRQQPRRGGQRHRRAQARRLRRLKPRV
jgi:Kelch motif